MSSQFNCRRHLSQEMTQKYLNGSLSPDEMYEVEDRLLESDFYFEAMEGLEKVPWDLCEKAVDSARERIATKYHISKKKSGATTKMLVAAFTLVMAAAGFWWYMQSETSQTYDLSPPPQETYPPSSQQMPTSGDLKSNETPVDLQTQVQDTIVAAEVKAEDPPDDIPNNGEPRQPAVGDASNYVAVGRIIDQDGQAIANVTVSMGTTSDTTDKSGYYALRVQPGKQTIQLKYGEFTADVDVNTNQNWEIVLDPVKSAIISSYPVIGANRFK